LHYDKCAHTEVDGLKYYQIKRMSSALLTLRKQSLHGNDSQFQDLVPSFLGPNDLM
jgi:hypothetical protein